MVGAPHDANEVGYRAGSAYIFNRYGPWVEQVTSEQEDGWYGIGDEILMDIHYDSTVQVEGSPVLDLYLTQGKAAAHYVEGSGTKQLTFKYTVLEGHHSTDLGYNGIFALGGSLTGDDGVAASKLLPSPGRRHSLKGSKNLQIDGKRPVLLDTLHQVDSTDHQLVAVHWTYDEPIYTLDSTRIDVENGMLRAIEAIDSTHFITHIRPYHGQTVVTMLEGSVHDQASNAALKQEVSFGYHDTIPPQVEILASRTHFSDTVVTISLHMSEPVRGFSQEMIQVQHGYIHELTTQDSMAFTAQVVAIQEGMVALTVPKNSIQDLGGNINTTDVSTRFVYDATPPTTEITSTEGDTVGGRFMVNLLFSEAVWQLEASDIAVENGKIDYVETSDSTAFKVHLLGDSDGLISILVPFQVVVDQAGNGNQASSQWARYYDATAPSILSDQFFTLDEKTAVGTILGTLKAKETAGQLREWTILPGNEDGLFKVDSLRGKLSVAKAINVDADTTYALMVTVADHFYTSPPAFVRVQILDADQTPPSVQLSSPVADTVTGSFIINITFSEQVVGFSLSDIVVENAVISELTTEDSVRFWGEVLPSDEGEVVLTIPAATVEDSAGNGNLYEQTFAVVYQPPHARSIVLGISEQSFTNVKVYPNPTSGKLYLAIPDDFLAYQLMLVDQQGKIVHSVRNKNSLDLTSLPKGIYTLIIHSGSSEVSQKVILE